MLDLRCIIVDDESGAIEILTRYVKKTPELELVRSFRDSIEALTFLAGNEVDIAFMDIDMPNLSGMTLTELIRDKNIQVIFCTAYSEYAVESYEKNAIDYLLKPIAYERFFKAVEKAKKACLLAAKTDKAGVSKSKGKIRNIFIKSGPRIHQVNFEDLLYMEKKGHYVVFFTSEKQLLSRMNMSDLLNSLPSDSFVRVHRSFVVALDKIDTIEKHTIVIQNNRIPIGESYRDDLFKRIQSTGK